MHDKFRELQTLYDSFPGVPCILGCGLCCATPSVTILEFIYLFKNLTAQVPRETIISWLDQDMNPHPWGGGNFLCRFQSPDKDRKCLVHSYRPAACRLFGLPVLNELQIENLEKCPVMDPRECPAVPLPELKGWLAAVENLNRDFPDYYCEPHWILGLNLECWLSVYFHPLLDQGVFGRLKKILHREIDLSFFAPQFKDQTGLKEKTDKISLFYSLYAHGDLTGCRELLNSIIHEYPLTGTYFVQEGTGLLEIINEKQGN
jgi:Fe-S-cluster containining protein